MRHRRSAVVLLIIAIVFATIEETSTGTTPKIGPFDVVIMVDQSLSIREGQAEEKYKETLKNNIEKTFDVKLDKTMITLIQCGVHPVDYHEGKNIGPSGDMNEIKRHIDGDGIWKEVVGAQEPDKENKEYLLLCMEYINKTMDKLDTRSDVDNLLIYYGDTVHDRTPIDEIMPTIKKKFKVFYWKVTPPPIYNSTYYKDIVKEIVSDGEDGVIELKENPSDDDVEGMKKNIVKSTCSESPNVYEECVFNVAECQITKTGQADKTHCSEPQRKCDENEKTKCCNKTFKEEMKKKCNCDTMTRSISDEAKKSGCSIPTKCTEADVKDCGTVTVGGPAPGKHGGDKDQMPTIIGAVIGGIALVLLVVVIVVVVVSKRKKKKAKEGQKGKGMSLKEAQAAEKARGVQADIGDSRFEGKSMKTAKEPSVKTSKSKMSRKGGKGEDTTSTKTATKSTATKSKTKSTATKSKTKSTATKSKSTVSKKSKK